MRAGNVGPSVICPHLARCGWRSPSEHLAETDWAQEGVPIRLDAITPWFTTSARLRAQLAGSVDYPVTARRSRSLQRRRADEREHLAPERGEKFGPTHVGE